MSGKVRCAVVGCGVIGAVHAGLLSEMAHAELVACCDIIPERAAEFSRRFGIPRATTDYAELLADPDVDAVYIATPPSTHAEYTVRAAAAGKPVYVEKPMARTHAECQEMIAACRQAGVPLYVAYYRRRLPRFLKVEELLLAGAIGAPRAVTVRLHYRPNVGLASPGGLPWRADPEVAGGGPLLYGGSATPEPVG